MILGLIGHMIVVTVTVPPPVNRPGDRLGRAITADRRAHAVAAQPWKATAIAAVANGSTDGNTGGSIDGSADGTDGYCSA